MIGVVSEGESDSAENENYSNESEHNDYAMVEEIIEAEAITEVE